MAGIYFFLLTCDSLKYKQTMQVTMSSSMFTCKLAYAKRKKWKNILISLIYLFARNVCESKKKKQTTTKI